MSKLEEARTRNEARTRARTAMRRLGFVLEIVPAPVGAGVTKSAQGLRYAVTFKRALNAQQAFAFEYIGTQFERDNHTAPATHDVVKAALATPQAVKFFSPPERAALEQALAPPVSADES